MVGAPTKPTPPPVPQPPAKPRASGPPRGDSPGRPGGIPALFVRCLISLWIVWHFSGVFLAALSLEGASPLVLNATQHPKSPMQWYLDASYMNQGRPLFAPIVGPAHVIRYDLLDATGQTIEKGELPSRKLHWPRLFYHRHMMLADQSDFPVSQQMSDYWQRKYLEAFGNHLLAINEKAQTVRLERLAHWPLRQNHVLEGRKLTDPETYEVLIQHTVSRAALPPSLPPNQSLYWQNSPPNTATRNLGIPR